MSKTWLFQEQWEISGHLRTVTPLHIGSGGTVTRPGLTAPDGPVDINAVVTDYTGKPYLPGSTLKGALRAWLEKQLNDEGRPCLVQLFGQEKETGEEKNNNHGGKAEFLDARIVFPHNGPTTLPYWDDCRQTYVAATVAINNVTRTARHRHLIHTEMVPPGVTFAVTLSGPLEEGETGLLLAALNGFNQSPPALVLGAHTANGFGRFSWELSAVKRFGKEHLRGWLEAEKRTMRTAAMEQLSDREIDDLQQVGTAQLDQQEDQVRLELELHFDGPFLVNNPLTTKEQEAKKEGRADIPNHRPLRDADGRPCLPESSVRGALRAQAARIIRTLGGTCCESNLACEKGIHTHAEIKELCPVCRVFGAPGWKSPLAISDFRFLDGEDDGHIQEFVAIDRFTGGAKDQAKFNAEYIGSPRFTGTIALDERRVLPDWGKGLLYLVLRDLAEGDITLGFGRSKGYGVCRADITELDLLLPEKSVAALYEKLAISPAADEPGTDPVREDSGLATAADDPASEATATPGTPKSAEPETFHNPYHFVPVVKPTAMDREHWIDKEILFSASENKTQHTHASYLDRIDDNKIYHGRIVCRLRAETPMFIGGRQREDTEPTEILPFTLGGKPAIPATSLRGMLSSIAEAASNSSLRVLEDKMLSYRKSSDDALSALGEVQIDNGNYRLRPLALPTMNKGANDKCRPPSKYMSRAFPEQEKPLLKILVGNYKDPEKGDGVLVDSQWSTFEKLAERQTGDRFYYLMTQPVTWQDIENKSLVLAQKVDLPQFRTSRPHRTEDYIRGKFKIMGGPKRGLPETVKREVFVPYPERHDWPDFELEIPPSVIDCFNDLADQRTASQKKETNLKEDEILPYQPLGAWRNENNAELGRKLRLRHGDIVYFRPDATGTHVEEISFSAIWRGRVEDDEQHRAGVHAFFKKIDRELLPFNPERAEISPAELLFGFVEEREQETDYDDQALAFAGKVRVSFAQLAAEQDPGSIFQDQVTLKALSSPKPPSPALYFTGNGAQSIAKPDLTLGAHRPQGRKFYLHAWQKEDDIIKFLSNGKKTSPKVRNGLYPWESKSNLNLPGQSPDKHARLKSTITPIKKGTVFYFHVDFDNLSEWELGLLCYALQPGEQFQHKLGMGKPIGLGSVHIEPAGLYLIHRKNRYSGGVVSEHPRYNGGVWQKSDEGYLREWQELYPLESTAAASSVAASPADFALQFSGTMKPSIKQSLEQLGDPDNVIAPVHYPQVEGADLEEETYKWFVANDSGSKTKNGKQKTRKEQAARQPLPPLTGEGPLPTLKRHKLRS